MGMNSRALIRHIRRDSMSLTSEARTIHRSMHGVRDVHDPSALAALMLIAAQLERIKADMLDVQHVIENALPLLERKDWNASDVR